MVRHAAALARRTLLRRLGAAGTVLLLAATLTGCLGSSSGGQRPVDVGPGIGGTPLRLANCTDWQKADASQRLSLVHQLANLSDRPIAGTQGGRGPVLDDKQAYRLFQNYCHNYFARGFFLYKLYGRAAAFAGH